MPSLADLIGRPPPGDVQLLQATVSGAPGAGTASIHFGDPTQVISGVRTLSSGSFADGDSVWVLQRGGSLIILGKLGPTTGAHSTVATRIVISPNTLDDTKIVLWSAPDFSLGIRAGTFGYFAPINCVHSFFVDGAEHFRVDAGAVRVYGNIPLHFETHGGGWHMSDATWVRSWGDKGVYTGGIMGANVARMGQSTYADHAEWSHANKFANATQYGFLHRHDGATFVNSNSEVQILNNNTWKLVVTNTGVATNGVFFSTRGASIYLKGDLDNSHRLYWHTDDGARLVSYGYVGLECVAQDHALYAVAQTRHVNRANNVWRYSDAAGHTNFSDPKGKQDMVPLRTALGSQRGKLKTIKPIRFKFRKEMADPEGDRDHLGFSADELPTEVVHEREMANGRVDKLINPVGVLALLWEAVAELSEAVDTIERLPVIAMNKPSGAAPV